MKKTIILLTILSILFLTTVNAKLPCEDLSEQECTDSYNQGYISSNECNSMFYCYPKYQNDQFTKCTTVTRTNFSDCQNSFSTCYNNIAVDETKSKDCFCDEGVKYKKIDACANPTDWTEECIKKESCEKYTKEYLGKEITSYRNCEVLKEPKDINCDKLAREEKECDENNVVIYKREYEPNECGTKCIISNIEKEVKKCDDCENGNCVIKLPKEEETSKNTILLPQEEKEEINETTETKNTTKSPKPKNDTKEPVFLTEDKKLEIKIKKNVPKETITILLSFIALFLTGAIFLIKTN